MKIYVVTQGEYSAYGIVGVAIDKKQAELIATLYSTYNDPCYVEEYDTEEIKVDKDFAPNWFVEFDNDEIKRVCHPFTGRKPFKVKEYNENLKQYGVIVKAKDEEHAKKIAIDTLAQYKALKAELVLTGDKFDNFMKVEEEK